MMALAAILTLCLLTPLPSSGLILLILDLLALPLTILLDLLILLPLILLPLPSTPLAHTLFLLLSPCHFNTPKWSQYSDICTQQMQLHNYNKYFPALSIYTSMQYQKVLEL